MDHSEQNSLGGGYWYNIKALLMILVVIGHFAQVFLWRDNTSGYYIVQGCVLFIYSFHMPLFVFISGYFSKDLEKRRKRAFYDLLRPYVMAQLALGILFFILNHSFTVFRNILIPSYGTWYLLALYIWRTMMPDIDKIKHNILIAFCLNLFIVATDIDNTVAMGRTIGFLVFFLMGYYANESTIHTIRKIPIAIAGMGIFLELCAWMLFSKMGVFNYTTIFSIFTHSYRSNNMDDILLGIINYSIAFVIAFINGILLIAITPKKTVRYSNIGDNTLPLYITHLLVVNIVYYTTINISNISYGIVASIAAICCLLLFSTKWFKRKFIKLLGMQTMS